MTNRLQSIALAACAAWLLPAGIPDAVAKQQCSSAMPSSTQGRWWSYRIIDGRKCWYEGKPMLSKSELEWPKQTSDVTDAVAASPVNPLNSQAWAVDYDTFEARWRARIGNR